MSAAVLRFAPPRAAGASWRFRLVAWGGALGFTAAVTAGCLAVDNWQRPGWAPAAGMATAAIAIAAGPSDAAAAGEVPTGAALHFINGAYAWAPAAAEIGCRCGCTGASAAPAAVPSWYRDYLPAEAPPSVPAGELIGVPR